MVAAKLVNKAAARIDPKTGKVIHKAKYTGMHTLRHFYASWCINRRIDGGLELPLKVVQAALRIKLPIPPAALRFTGPHRYQG